MRRLALAVVAVLLGFSAGCARPTEPRPAVLQPLAVDWTSYFTIESRATSQDGRALVSGTVTNTTGWRASRIQLLVDGLDATGQVVSQRVAWLGVDLPAGGHAYFDVPVAPASAGYRVQVFAFDTSRRK